MVDLYIKEKFFLIVYNYTLQLTTYSHGGRGQVFIDLEEESKSMKNRDKQSHTDCITSHHISDVVTWVSIGCISGVAYTAVEAEYGSFSTSLNYIINVS